MKTALIVAYHFPPSEAVGAIRPSKFVRYLPQFGVRPIVVTAAMSRGESSQSCDVLRVREWPHPIKWREEKYLARMGAATKPTRQFHVSHADASRPSGRSRLRRMRRWLVAFLWLPDRETGWIIPAVRASFKVIRDQKPDYLISTGPPFSCHLVGLVLKRLTGIRWVVDMRDPWSVKHKSAVLRNGWTDKLEAALIARVMKGADAILSVTDAMTDDMRADHLAVDPGKVRTVTNGFDPMDFASLTNRSGPSGKIAFAYLGTFYQGRTPRPFLAALAELIKERRMSRDDVRVELVGHVEVADGESVANIVREYRLDDIVTIKSHVARNESLGLALQADVVLVLTEHQPHALTYKLFEALGAGAVILNIGTDGAVAEVLRKTNRGVAVDYRKPSEIKTGILECIDRAKSRRERLEHTPWEESSIQAFNIRELTRELVRLLDKL